MTDTWREPNAIRFQDFELDVRAGELKRAGNRVRLQQQPLHVLVLLLERPGDVVTRDEIRTRLWPEDTFVDFDHGLNKAINKLRDALGDSAQEPKFVETLPRRGYRFIGDIAEPSASEAEPPPATSSVLPKWAGGLVALVAVAAALVWLGSKGTDRSSRLAAKTMLAVLPFENLATNPEQDYFCDGLTEEMIAVLGNLNPDRLGVIARTSAMQYKQTTKRVDQIADELGVTYVLEGTVRRSDDRVRITAQLIQVSDQTHLWSESYDRSLEDVFEIQGDVAQRIAESLTLELLPNSSVRTPTSSPAAYESYLRGRFHWNKRTAEGFEQGLTHFENAVEKDPDYALAHVGIADSYIMLANYGTMSPTEALPRAIDAADRALAIDPNLPDAMFSRTWAEWIYDLDWAAAERGFQRALEIGPRHSFSHQLYANYLVALGRHEDAIREMERARELDPISLVINSVLAWHYLLAREPDLAIEQCQRTLELDASFSRVHSYLGWAYLQQSRFDDAVTELERSLALFGDSAARSAELAHAYASNGRLGEAREILRSLEELSRERYVEAALIAKIYVGLNDTDNAIRWLERALVDRSVQRPRFNVDPLLDPLRDDPRFNAISSRIGFPDRS